MPCDFDTRTRPGICYPVTPHQTKTLRECECHGCRYKRQEARRRGTDTQSVRKS